MYQFFISQYYNVFVAMWTISWKNIYRNRIFLFYMNCEQYGENIGKKTNNELSVCDFMV